MVFNVPASSRRGVRRRSGVRGLRYGGDPRHRRSRSSVAPSHASRTRSALARTSRVQPPCRLSDLTCLPQESGGSLQFANRLTVRKAIAHNNQVDVAGRAVAAKPTDFNTMPRSLPKSGDVALTWLRFWWPMRRLVISRHARVSPTRAARLRPPVRIISEA
jgi:hypothetical protein